MIAHSLPDPFFGPAQNMHGATFVVDVAFMREELTDKNVVVDIGAALNVLNATLKPLAYQNLDEIAEFTSVKKACELLGRPRGSHYRARQPRVHDPAPKPTSCF